MTIQNDTLITVLVLVLLIFGTGLQMVDHQEHGKEVKALNERLDATDRRLAGMEELLRLHVSRNRAIVPRSVGKPTVDGESSNWQDTWP